MLFRSGGSHTTAWSSEANNLMSASTVPGQGRRWVGFSDMNGDGIADPCVFSPGISNVDGLVCYISNPSGGERYKVKVNISTDTSSLSASSSFVDFNRDGLVDFCYVSAMSSDGSFTASGADFPLYCSFLSDAGAGVAQRYSFGPSVQINQVALPSSNTQRIIALGFRGTDDALGAWVDINGDGMLDYCVHHKNINNSNRLERLSCFIGDGKSLSFAPTRFAQWNAAWTHPAGRSFVDLNGDGKTDFCGVGGTTNVVDHILTCNLLLNAPVNTVDPNASNNVGVSIAPTATVLNLGRSSSGPGFDNIDWGQTSNERYRDIVDISGNGSNSFCRAVGAAPNGSTEVVCTGIGPAALNTVLKKAQALGREIVFNYEHLPLYSKFATDGNVILTAGTNTPGSSPRTNSGPNNPFIFPMVATVPPTYVVSSTDESTTGISGARTTQYGYRNFAVDVASGRGALGFEVTEVFSQSVLPGEAPSNTGSVFSRTRTTANLNWPFVGQPILTELFSPSGALIKSVVVETPTSYATNPIFSTCGGISRPSSASSAFAWPIRLGPSTVTETSYLPAGTTSQSLFVSRTKTIIGETVQDENALDECGNVKQINVVIQAQDGVTTGYEKFTTSSFNNNIDANNNTAAARWYLGRLATSSVRHRAPERVAAGGPTMPQAGATLDPVPPPVVSPYPWLPAVLGLLLN